MVLPGHMPAGGLKVTFDDVIGSVAFPHLLLLPQHKLQQPRESESMEWSTREMGEEINKKRMNEKDCRTPTNVPINIQQKLKGWPIGQRNTCILANIVVDGSKLEIIKTTFQNITYPLELTIRIFKNNITNVRRFGRISVSIPWRFYHGVICYT